jgi:hypothetical protein
VTEQLLDIGEVKDALQSTVSGKISLGVEPYLEQKKKTDIVLL